MPGHTVPAQPAQCVRALVHVGTVREAVPPGVGSHGAGSTRLVPHGEPHPLAPTPCPLRHHHLLVNPDAARHHPPGGAVHAPLRAPHARPPTPASPLAPCPGAHADPHHHVWLQLQPPQRLHPGTFLGARCCASSHRHATHCCPLSRWAGPLRVGDVDQHCSRQGAAEAQGGWQRVPDSQGRAVRFGRLPQLLRRDRGVAWLCPGSMDACGLGLLPLHLRQPRTEGERPAPVVHQQVRRQVPGVAQGVHPVHLLTAFTHHLSSVAVRTILTLLRILLLLLNNLDSHNCHAHAVPLIE
ncbi:uncharacterized protein [Oryza sativa Japonica Group]|uniref:cDNA, clone: J053099M17, full insert sequence n=1 Tax=Oryza sativa subsp. japonica TaxID=39947 RepID=B7F8B7_ORYSJ|nr:uncharacterized protein LOC9272051 isoform X1 [Oryza sativa Japonica Group]BAH00865.1 unnamed protein product [Oryza sativa Japonica Group]